MARILLLSILILYSIGSYSQGKNESNNQQYLINCRDCDSPQPYYVIIAEDKQLGIDGVKNDDPDNILVYLEPKWIDSISVFKGEYATNKYGKLGENGVVEVHIKKRKIKHIPPDILAKFVPIKD